MCIRDRSSEAVADMPPVEASATAYAATCYLLENRQGEVAGIGSQRQKDQTRAPEHATYIAIAGEADGTQVVYRIYLGENNTTDFNVGRNRVYNIDARILGLNTCLLYTSISPTKTARTEWPRLSKPTTTA